MRRFDRWAPRMIAALVFLVPLCFSTALYDTYDLPKLTLVYLGDLLLVTLWFWQSMDRGEWIVHRTALDVPLSLFLGVGVLSACLSIDPSLSFYGAYRIYVFGWWPMVSFIALYFLTAQVDPATLAGPVCRAALLSAACVAFYAVLQYAGYEIFQEIPGVKGGRAWSSLGNPLYMGAVCAMALPQTLNLMGWKRIMGISLAVAGLVLSLSRSAWVGAFVAGVYSIFVFRHHVRQWGARAAASALVVILFMVLMPHVRERFQVLVSRKEASNAARLEGWKAGLRVWREYPVLGSGPDTFFQAFRPHRTEAYLKAAGAGVTQADAHNDLIQMAATEGTLGLIAYLWVAFVFLRKVLSKKTGPESLCAASLLALIVQNQFNFSSVATSAWAAIFAGLLFGTERQVEKGKKGKSEIEREQIHFKISFQPFVASSFLLFFAAAGLWAISIPVRADWHYKQGLIWNQRQQPFLAIPHFREAVRLNDRVEIFGSELANAPRSTGNFDEAWKAANDITRQHPHNPDAWNNLGVGAMWMVQLARQDKWQEAKTSFEKAISLDPVFVDAWANLAKWHHLRGNLDEEKRLWKKVLELDPNHEMAKSVLH